MKLFYGYLQISTDFLTSRLQKKKKKKKVGGTLYSVCVCVCVCGRGRSKEVSCVCQREIGVCVNIVTNYDA